MAEWVLLGVLVVVLYPMLAGVTYRFLGRHDRLGLLNRYTGSRTKVYKRGYCNYCNRDYWYCGHAGSLKANRSDGKTPGFWTDRAWKIAFIWPAFWMLVTVVYLGWFVVLVPGVTLAKIGAGTARFVSGERQNRDKRT